MQAISDFNFKNWKKSRDGAAVQKNQNKYEINDISTIDMPPAVPGLSKNLEDQTEDHFGELEC